MSSLLCLQPDELNVGWTFWGGPTGIRTLESSLLESSRNALYKEIGDPKGPPNAEEHRRCSTRQITKPLIVLRRQ